MLAWGVPRTRAASAQNDLMRRGTQALAIPAVGVLTLVVAVALTHREAPLPRSTPVGPSPLVTATPNPTSFPPLFLIPDDFRLVAPRAYGVLTTTRGVTGYTFDVTVTAPPANTPAALPVWNLSRTPVDAAAVAARFGLPPTPDRTWSDGGTYWTSGLEVNTVHSNISWLAANGAPNPRLGSVPRDNLTAAVAAEEWLRRSGLAPTTMNPPQVFQTANGESASFAEWAIYWPRAAPDYPQWTIDGTSARVSADGTLKQLDAPRATIDKGSLYPLRPWQDALADARRGRWFRAPEMLPEFTPTPGVLHITATVSITYAVVDTAQGSYAVPMYAFNEKGSGTPGLVPAIAP